MRSIVITLTFDSSPIKGEGVMVGLSCSPSPLIPLPSRERGIWLVCLAFTLAFDSSPIKGEGDMVGLSCCHPALWIPAYAGMTDRTPPLWIADQVRNDMVPVSCLGAFCFLMM